MEGRIHIELISLVNGTDEEMAGGGGKMEVCDGDEGRRRRLLLLERGRRLWREDGARFCCHVAADAAAADAAVDDAAVGGPVTGNMRAIWGGPLCFGTSSSPRALHFDGGLVVPVLDRVGERGCVVMGQVVLYSGPTAVAEKYWGGGQDQIGARLAASSMPDGIEQSTAQHSTARHV